jgi:hypothetical protein
VWIAFGALYLVSRFNRVVSENMPSNVVETLVEYTPPTP